MRAAYIVSNAWFLSQPMCALVKLLAGSSCNVTGLHLQQARFPTCFFNMQCSLIKM